jgi:hypothetical protein
MKYSKEIIWTPIYLNGETNDLDILLENNFANLCLETKLSEENQINFNETAKKEITKEKYKNPFLFHKDTFFVDQIGIDSDRWLESGGNYKLSPLERFPSKPIIYSSKNFDRDWDRKITLKLFDFWISHIEAFQK